MAVPRSSIFAVLFVLIVGISCLCLYYRPLSGRRWQSSVLRVLSPKPALISPYAIVTLVSPMKDAIGTGDILHFFITTVCEANSTEPDCAFGGDFWSATLASESNPRASTAAHLTDHGNGTYSAYFYAGWVGTATVSVTLVLRSQAVDFLKDVIWPADDRVVWQGYFKIREDENLSRMPKGICRLRSHGNWSGMCEYPHPRALGKTVFICEKPEGVSSCESLFATKSDGSMITARVDELTRGRGQMYLRSNYYRRPIRIVESTITIAGSTNHSNIDESNLPECVPDQELPISHGYWLQGKWHSLLCNITDWTAPSKLKSCLRDKKLILLGDSTTRQWFLGIHELLGIIFNRKPGERQFTWRTRFEEFNSTILYTAHPQLVGSLVVYLTEVHYEVDVLDGLTDLNCDYIVLVSPWAHFIQWTRENYVDRTERLRDALVGFRQRCPDAKIVLKGPHARDHRTFEAVIYSSDVIMKEIEEINRRTLHGIGVWYLPVWAMNSAHPTPNTIHMPMEVIKEELKMFFSYVCKK